MADLQKGGSNTSGNEPSPLASLSKTHPRTLLRLWLVFVAILFLPYLGMYLMGFRFIGWLEFLLGTIPIAAAIVLLLELDRHERHLAEREEGQNGAQLEPQQPALDTEAMTKKRGSTGNSEKKNGMSVAELIYRLFVQRKSLIALFVLCTTLTVLMSYRFILSFFRVEYEGASGVVVHLPGETVYYIPIYPYSSSPQESGWQNTGIEVQKDDEFTFEVSGMVSPGHLQNTPAMTDWTNDNQQWWDCKMAKSKPEVWKKMGCRDRAEPSSPARKWPFTGPEGYHAAWYPEPPLGNNDQREGKPGYEYIRRHYQDDEGLTIKGVPHNWVIGVIRPEKDGPPYKYDFAKDKDILVNFSCKQDEYPREYKPTQTGVLWVVINDADAYRWDNEGWFLLKLTKNPKGLPPRWSKGPCLVPQAATPSVHSPI